MKTTIALALALLVLSSGCTRAAPLPPKAVELNRDGAAALAAGDLVTAEARLGVALEYNPRFTEAWVNLGLVELKRGNFALARKHLRRARDLNPDLPAPHHALGLLCESEARDADAEEHYRDALKVDPGFVPARVNLARKMFERGAYEEARAQSLRLIEVDGDAIEGWTGLVESLSRLQRFDEADDALAQAKERFGERTPIALLEARRLLRRAAFAEAEALLARVIEKGKETLERAELASAWAWIAVARLCAGNREGTVAAAREALRLEETQPVARYALAQLGVRR